MLDDLRKTIEARIGEFTPARAKSLAKSLAGPGAAKDQVAKSAADIIEWSQKNRDRIKEFVRREVSSQVGVIGVAAQADLDALKKRVRTLERRAGATATTPADRAVSGGKAGTRKATTAKAATSSPGKKSGRTSAKGTGATRAQS